MMTNKKLALIVCAVSAGAVNGTLGAGGGMVLVPLLTWLARLEDDQVFPTSVSVILPISIVSLFLSPSTGLSIQTILPYLLGSIAGGILCGFLGRRIPVKWLHRGLGILMIWGGIRYLC